MDPTTLIAIITAHRWIALAAILIGLGVRLCKSDTIFPLDVHPRLRAFLALGLGGAAAVFDKLTDNTSWTVALLSGAAAAIFAIVGHDVGIDSLRGGKELVIPGLMKPGASPGPGKPPTTPPPGDAIPVSTTVPPTPPSILSRAFTIGALLMASIILANCALFTTKNAKMALDLGDVACIIANAMSTDKTVATVCKIADVFIPDIQAVLAEQRKAIMMAQISTLKTCSGGDHASPVCIEADGGMCQDGGAK